MFLLFFYCREEAQEYIEMGAINSLFVLGRSIGFIGKFLTQFVILNIWTPNKYPLDIW